MATKILSILELVLAVLLIIAILLQQKGSGLGTAFGGGSEIYATRRGIDKVLYQATIGIAVLFFGIALLLVVL
ncbi:MAG: preprotein translocase subunit SecG [Patescibacteria group bacterium]